MKSRQATSDISMACKVLRVYVRGNRVASQYSPVKTGETSDEGIIKDDKFEADGALSADEIKAIRTRAQTLANADAKLDDSALQALFVKTFDKFDAEVW